MDRVIKFRVWDKENKVMSEGVPFDWFIKGEDDLEFKKDDTSLPLKDFIFFYSDYVINQYTGFNDKGGKEVHEGDILYRMFGDLTEVYVQIAFDRATPGWIGETTGRFHSFCDEPLEYYEVAGNIYENAELLNKVVDAD